MKPIYFMIFSNLLFSSQAADAISFQSTEQQTALIELYTSEGCSSCPPADRWISQLKTDPKLWQDFIPIAFHVDYWDYIGWKDTLALAGNTQRQGQYKAENKIAFVYTPGFIINGEEWQDWFNKRSLPTQNRPNVGILKADIKGNNIVVNYLGAKQNLEYHVAILGFDIQSQVKAGENEGQSLNHDFVALSHESLNSADNQVSLNLAESGRFNTGRAIAVWINTPDSLAPIQAVGGWLP